MNRLPLGVDCPACGKEVHLESKSSGRISTAMIHAHAELHGVPLICDSCERVFLYRRLSRRHRLTANRRCLAYGRKSKRD